MVAPDTTDGVGCDNLSLTVILIKNNKTCLMISND